MREELLNSINAIIEEAEEMKNAYFFKPPSNSGGRRWYEKTHSHDEIKWEENNHTYTAEYVVKCSCQNIYAYGVYTKDGKKTTLTTIKNSYKRMMNA